MRCRHRVRLPVAMVLGVIGVTTVCSGVYAKKNPPRSIETPWSNENVAWSKGVGTNTIKGTALLRTVGGDPKTCAALQVTLVPKSPYAVERMSYIYGLREPAFTAVENHPRLEDPPVGYMETVRQTRCDADGRFSFEEVPDGEYFLTAAITWGIPGRYSTQIEGGVLMQSVKVAGGQTKNIVLAQ